MNIWYFHPDAGSPTLGKIKPNRSYFLSKEWVVQGHQVTVISGSNSHYSGMDLELKDLFMLEHTNGMTFMWLKTPKQPSSAVKRLWHMLNYRKMIQKLRGKILDLAGQPDVIICSIQPPFHLKICHKFAKQYNARFIVEVRDLWPLSMNEIMGVPKWHPVSLWVGHYQRYAYRHADRLVSLLSNAKDYMCSQGLQAQKFSCIPNGYTPVQDNSIDTEHSLVLSKLKALKAAGKFVIGYTGAHGVPNHLYVICEAITQIGDDNIHLILVGDGTIKADLQDKYRNENIHFVDPQPKMMIPLLLEYFDMAYIGAMNRPIYQYGVSFNKIYETLYYGKPVIASKYPNNTPIHVSGAGLFFENDSVNDLASIIQLASEMDADALKEKGLLGRALVMREYTYQKLAQDYIEVMQ